MQKQKKKTIEIKLYSTNPLVLECVNNFIKKIFGTKASINNKKYIRNLIVLRSPFIDKKSYEQYKNSIVVSFILLKNITINYRIVSFINLLFYNLPCNVFISIKIFKYS